MQPTQSCRTPRHQRTLSSTSHSPYTLALRVVVKGGGDIGTGIAWRLHRCGFCVLVTEIDRPTVIRRAVAFASAVYEETFVLQGVTAHLVVDDKGIADCWATGQIPVLVDRWGAVIQRLRADAVVDAIVAKRNLGTRVTDAPVVVAVGPGFTAGVDCHAVIESSRGHSLGRVLLDQSAEPNTGVPGAIAGESERRLLRAPVSGTLYHVRQIGDIVSVGDTVALVDDIPVCAGLDGVLRGLLYAGLWVCAGRKVGDIDPRGEVAHCFSISDKALAIGGGVVEAVLYLLRKGHPCSLLLWS